MKTVERVRKLANDQLEIVITITDPATYSAPLEARYSYKLHSGLRLEDYNCGELHRDISQVPGVATPASAQMPAPAQTVAAQPASTQPAATVPDFDGLWTAGGFEPPATGRGGMTMHPDPAYRYRGTREDDRSRQNTIPPIADLTDPLLKPWAAEVLRPIVTRRIAGEIIPEARSQCLPMGTPMLLVEGGPRVVLQEKDQITIIHEELPEVRRIYLNVPHSEHPTPSWYGESVGHFEGETLVVDTIGISDKTWVDDFLTPHTANMHVVERYTKRDANTIQIDFTIEDPDTFTETWGGRVTWTRAAVGTKFQEVRCSEYNFDVVTGATLPMPVATKLDF